MTPKNILLFSGSREYRYQASITIGMSGHSTRLFYTGIGYSPSLLLLTLVIIIIVNAFQYYRTSNELKTEELETSEVLTVCSNLCSQPLDTLP